MDNKLIIDEFKSNGAFPWMETSLQSPALSDLYFLCRNKFEMNF